MHGLGGHGGTQSTYGGCCPAVHDLGGRAHQSHYHTMPLALMVGRTGAALEAQKISQGGFKTYSSFDYASKNRHGMDVRL